MGCWGRFADPAEGGKAEEGGGPDEGDGASGLQARLERAVGDAQAQAQAALAACALVEASHWELGRGLGAVAAVRANLAALRTELAAGRAGTAQVLCKVRARRPAAASAPSTVL